MARKIYFDTRSNGIGRLAVANGFSESPTYEPRVYRRSKLEIRQEDSRVYLINHARNEYMVFGTFLFGMDLKEFIRTGILPGNKKQIKSLPIE